MSLFIEVDFFGWRSTFLPKLSFFPICSVVERASPWQGSSRKTGVAAPKQFLPTASSDPPQTLKCSNSHIPQRCSDAKILGCCNTRMLKYSLNIQMLRSCKEARVFRCSDVQMLKCLDAQCALHICSDPARTNYSTLCFITAAGNFGNFATAVEE